MAIVSQEKHCDICGFWTEWQPWAPCSTTCGTDGVRERQRTCSLGPAMCGLSSAAEEEECSELENCETGIYQADRVNYYDSKGTSLIAIIKHE